MTLPRRRFLQLSPAALAGASLPARATPSGEDLKFIFVFASGGWDPTRVFADGFDHGAVDMEPGAERVRLGDLSYVAHSDRPSVSTFFDGHADRAIILNGVMVRSIALDICTQISMTGTTSGLSPDWPAALAEAAASHVTLPHLVLAGPSFPGPLGPSVARTGGQGQLEALLSGDILAWNDQPSTGALPDTIRQDLIDRYVLGRTRAGMLTARSSMEQALADDLHRAASGAVALKGYRHVMSFRGGSSVAEQGEVAAAALSNGLCRCLTLEYGDGAWDSHVDNDATQSTLWENLFEGLGRLMQRLNITPGTVASTLAEETVVVLLSEMGRTPLLNAFAGKDHWPYTSMMIVGPGLQGGRSVGAWDEGWYGQDVDPASGEVAPGTQALSAEAVGATLLALGGVDPGSYVSGVEPITGLLA
jgi:hypothetical protein